MKNNLILNVLNIKKMLKGICVMLLFVGMNSLDAKGGKKGAAQAATSTGAAAGQKQAVQQKQAGPVQGKQLQPKLSALGQFGLKNNITAATLQTFLDQNRDELSQEDKAQKTQNIEAIEARIAKLKKTEKVSSKDQQIADMSKEITKLRKMLKQSTLNKEDFNAALAEALAKQRASSAGFESYFTKRNLLAAGGAIAAAALALTREHGKAESAMAALSVVGLVFGLNKLSTRWKTGYWDAESKADAIAELLLATQLSDTGRYPTIKSKLLAIDEGDFINVDKDVSDAIFTAALKKLKEIINMQGDDKQKKEEQLLDQAILAIRAEYGRDPQNLEDYLKRLESAVLEKSNINENRALVSEYLRTTAVIFMKEEREKMKQAVQEEAKKQEQEAQESGWSIWDYIPSGKA